MSGFKLMVFNCSVNLRSFSIVLMLFLWLCSGLMLSACDMPAMPWSPPEEAATPSEETEEEEAEAEPETHTSPEPLNEVSLLPPAMKALPFKEISIPMADQLLLYGRLYYPSLKTEADHEEGEEDSDEEEDAEVFSDAENANIKKHPLVILVHGLSDTHLAWGDFPATLVKAGYAVFALDLRGHGKSTETVHHNKVTWHFFEVEHWKKLSLDMNQVMQFFQHSKDYPAIDSKSVALIGEKLGANVVVPSAVAQEKAVKTIVLISPGLNYKGLIPSQSIIDFDNSVLLIADKYDAYSMRSTERLYQWVLGKKTLQIYKKISEKGTRFSEGTALGDNMITWLHDNMMPPDRSAVTQDLQDDLPGDAASSLGSPIEVGEQ